ncbi:MAG: L,D-transpeptidase family protein [Ghiorsea sp.]|nr:L,D-transpeptidase family protein [Ghiorsea sp.]
MKRISLILCCVLLFSSQAFAEIIQLSANLSHKMWQTLEKNDAEGLGVHERSILGATLALEENNPKKALLMLDIPSSQGDPLANLLKAEAHRRAALEAVSSVGDYAKHHKLSKQQFAAIDLSEDLTEATVRLQAFADKIDGTAGFPFDILQVNNHIFTVFLVDKARSRLFVYQRNSDGELVRVADEYVVTGAKGGDKKARGDSKTPNGIYRFTTIRHDPALRAQYGPVVFPIDYPNALDKLQGKTGDGIWMHGYPEHKTRRPPQDTRGCFALPNTVLKQMEAYVKPGQTWVVIGENFKFVARKQQTDLRSSIQASIQSWKHDWESLDADAYLSHYHTDFRSGKYNLKRWKSYKKRVNSPKKYIRVGLKDMAIIHDPTPWKKGEMVVVEFKQRYQSSNYSDSGQKRLYLTRNSSESPWQILIEESL